MKETYKIYMCHSYKDGDYSDPEFCEEIDAHGPEDAAETYIEQYDNEYEVCKGHVYKVMVEDIDGNWYKYKVSGEATVNYYTRQVL